MKKFIATALCVTMLCSTALAKGSEDRKPFLDTSRSSKLIELEVGVGVGSSAFRQNYGSVITTVADLETASGVKMNFGANATFGLRDFLGLSTGLWFNICNNSCTMTMVDAGVGTLNTQYTQNHYYSVTIPLVVSFRFNVSNNVKWIINGGTYFTQGVDGTSKVRTYVSGTNELGQAVVTTNTYKFKYYEEEYPLINGVDRSDWGLRVGTGLKFNDRIKVAFDANFGLRNLARNNGVYNCRYRTWDTAINLMYCF